MPLGVNRAAFECGLGENLANLLNCREQQADKNCDDPCVNYENISHISAFLRLSFRRFRPYVR